MANGNHLSVRGRLLEVPNVGSRVGGFTPRGATPRWGELFTLRCVRCTTERHDVINA